MVCKVSRSNSKPLSKQLLLNFTPCCTPSLKGIS
jgi:hypothetical protein